MNDRDRRNTAQHRRAQKEYIQRNPLRSLQPWRQHKETDIIAFNVGAEQRFAEWLADKIMQSPDHSVAVGWTIGNAAFELDVSTATIKRYLMKWTADIAPFKSDGKIITLRHPELLKEPQTNDNHHD